MTNILNPKTVEAHRPPTPYEIKLGYGATHWRTFDVEDFRRKDGTLKMRIKRDGLVWSRR